MTESEIRAEELRLRSRELDIKQQQLNHETSQTGNSPKWYSSPLVSGAIALFTAGVTGLISGLWSMAQKEREQQFQIIMRATENRTPEEATKNLLYFVDIGYLQDDDGKIRRKAEAGIAPVVTSPSVPSVDVDFSRTENIAKNQLKESIEKGSNLTEAEVKAAGTNLFTIKNHVLFSTQTRNPVTAIETPHVSSESLINPELVVIHSSLSDNAGREVTYYASTNARGAVHIVIDRNGTVYQMAPFNQATWHAGAAKWKDRNVNRISLSISLINLGPLVKDGNQWKSAIYPSKLVASNDVVTLNDSVTHKPRGWHKFPPPQMQSLERVCKALFRAYPSLGAIVRTTDVNKQKADNPGPAFPLETLKRNVLGN